MMRKFPAKRPPPVNQVASDADVVRAVMQLWRRGDSLDELGGRMKDLAFKFAVVDAARVQAALNREISCPAFVEFAITSFIADRQTRNVALGKARRKLASFWPPKPASAAARQSDSATSSSSGSGSAPAVPKPAVPVPVPEVTSLVKPLERLLQKVAAAGIGRGGHGDFARLEQSLMDTLQAHAPAAAFEDMHAARPVVRSALEIAKKNWPNSDNAPVWPCDDVAATVGDLLGAGCMASVLKRAESVDRTLDSLRRQLQTEDSMAQLREMIENFENRDASSSPEQTFEKLLRLMDAADARSSKFAFNQLKKLASKTVKDKRWLMLMKGMLSAHKSVRANYAYEWFKSHRLSEISDSPVKPAAATAAPKSAGEGLIRLCQIFSVWEAAPKPLSFLEVEVVKNLVQTGLLQENEVAVQLDSVFAAPVAAAVQTLLGAGTSEAEAVLAKKTLNTHPDSPFGKTSNFHPEKTGKLKCRFSNGTLVEVFSAVVCVFGRILLLGLDPQAEFGRLQQFFNFQVQDSEISRSFFERAANSIESAFELAEGRTKILSEAFFCFLPKMKANASKSPVSAVLVSENQLPVVPEKIAPVPQIPTTLLAAFETTGGNENLLQELCNLLARTQESSALIQAAQKLSSTYQVKIRDAKIFETFVLILVMRTVGVTSKDSVEAMSRALSSGFQ